MGAQGAQRPVPPKWLEVDRCCDEAATLLETCYQVAVSESLEMQAVRDALSRDMRQLCETRRMVR